MESNKSEVTTDLIMAMAHHYNKRLFMGSLDINGINFVISGRLKRARGNYCTDNTLKIARWLLVDNTEWHVTLVHELIHRWQHENGYSLSHGSSFHNKADEIRDISNGEFNITTKRALSSSCMEARSTATKSKATNYLVKGPKGFNFLSNLTIGEVQALQARDYKVFTYTGNIAKWRKCRNYESFIERSYHYNLRLWSKVENDIKIVSL